MERMEKRTAAVRRAYENPAQIFDNMNKKALVPRAFCL